jgi:hypothetical protein
MSQLPGTGAPSEPIDVDIPVHLVSDPESTAKLALEPNSVDPIQKIEVLLPSEIFGHEFRDPVARHVVLRLGSDPYWDYDENGPLVHHTPSGEFQVHIPPVLRPRGPIAIVKPLAEDGSDLSGGTGSSGVFNPVYVDFDCVPWSCAEAHSPDPLEPSVTATCSLAFNFVIPCGISLAVAPRYFLRRNGPSDSEVETVDVTTPLGCHALTRRPGRSVGKTDR